MKRPALLVAMLAYALAAPFKLTPLNEASYPKMLAEHKGKIVLVDFWATYCVPCRAEMPQMVKLMAKLKAKGVDFVTVSADEPEQEMAAYKVLQGNGVTAPSYIKKAGDDDKFYNVVDAKWSGEMPATFIYDRSGKRVRSFLGDTPVNVIEAAIQKLLP